MGTKKRTKKSDDTPLKRGSSKRPRKRKPEESKLDGLAKKIFEETNGKKKRKNVKRPMYEDFVPQKKAIPICEIKPKTKTGLLPFQFAHNELRGRVMRLGNGSAYVEVEILPEDEDAPRKYENYHVSLQTKIYPLTKKRGK